MADTPVNPLAGALSLSGYAPAVVQRQPGLVVSVWLITRNDEVNTTPIADTAPVTIRG